MELFADSIVERQMHLTVSFICTHLQVRLCSATNVEDSNVGARSRGFD